MVQQLAINSPKSLSSTSSWSTSSSDGAVGNTDYPAFRNKTGFSAFPGGYRNTNGSFNDINNTGLWWIFDENNSGNGYGIYIGYYAIDVFFYSHDIKSGFSVRCIKD